MWDDQWKGKTIGTALDHAARKYGDKVATEFHNGAITYNQLKKISDLIACGFLKLGIGKSDKVAIWMAGYSEWALVYFALMRSLSHWPPVLAPLSPSPVAFRFIPKARSSAPSR